VNPARCHPGGAQLRIGEMAMKTKQRVTQYEPRFNGHNYVGDKPLLDEHALVARAPSAAKQRMTGPFGQQRSQEK
jgi:hypothetical protein